MPLELEEQIKLSYETLGFIQKRVDEIYVQVEATKSKVKLKKLLEEVQMWGKKCEREALVIEKMKKEQGLELE